MELTDDKRQAVAQIARRHGFGEDAALSMLDAITRGHGRQAQFDNPEFGGMGQWSGGMLMIGDMFNNGLKGRVDALIRDLAAIGVTEDDVTGAKSSSQGAEDRQEAGGMQGAGDKSSDRPLAKQSPVTSQSFDWPDDLGRPSSSGSQNGMEYAVFPDTNRLAIRQDGVVTVYDTKDHRIGGVSQQQGGSRSLTFTSQNGPVSLDSLSKIGG